MSAYVRVNSQNLLLAFRTVALHIVTIFNQVIQHFVCALDQSLVVAR